MNSERIQTTLRFAGDWPWWAGIGAALLGALADHTSIVYVFKVCAWLPLLGILTVFLPDTKGAVRLPGQQ